MNIAEFTARYVPDYEYLEFVARSLDRGRIRLTARRHGSPYAGIDRSVDPDPVLWYYRKKFEPSMNCLLRRMRQSIDIQFVDGVRRETSRVMGTTIHDFVCVVGPATNRENPVDGAVDEPGPLQRAHDMAIDIGLIVTPIMPHELNGDSTFFICPDGSNEGWADSQEYDEKRDTWKNYVALRVNRCLVSWVHVRFGETGDGSAYVDSEHCEPKSLQEQFTILERELQKMGARAQKLEQRIKSGER